MKDTLKRLLGIPQEAPVVETKKDDLNMELDNSGDLAKVMAQDVAGLQATIAALSSELTEKNAQVAELTELVAKATAYQENQVKVAAEAKSASRLAALASVLGDEQAVTMNASLASLSDEAFSGVVTSLGVKSKTEAATPLFKEVGVDGEVDSTKLEDEAKGSGVMDYLTAKYKTN